MKKKLLQIRIEEEFLKELQESNALSVSSQVRILIKHALKK